ncbi:flagellar motor switch protein FliM [Sinomonas sp. JGH33]|uniref:Flagellar motor switch protein FliM n=1 Tax=Sinomonas terricola TaxID=3110330 RepID=A0ABU5T510_9MICC|nr:flagellar motor switch protein FliM [Sinomonas sp. JGH33]MEA5454756.1 flagellar motor switch protein FliM [Sinomonas sp. JGH33]
MTVQDLEVPAPKTVEAYDFRRPTTLAREHSRILEVGFETFARQWGTQLTAKVRVKSTVTTESVVMQTYDEYVSSLPSTTAMVLCVADRIPASSGKMVIQFPTASALGWVARMLGGHGDKAGLDRKFTPLEHALIKSLMDEALEDLSYSLGGLLEGNARVEAIQYNSQFAQAAATTDLMIVVAFTVRVGDSASDATLAIPADALLPQLGAVNPMASSANAAELMREQLGEVPLDVVVRLAPAAVTPAQILNLAVGDTLFLPHAEHEPFDVSVGGKNLAQAMAVRKGSRVAARIVATTPNPTEETHP